MCIRDSCTTTDPRMIRGTASVLCFAITHILLPARGARAGRSSREPASIAINQRGVSPKGSRGRPTSCHARLRNSTVVSGPRTCYECAKLPLSASTGGRWHSRGLPGMSLLRRGDAAPDEESGKLDCKWSSAVVVEESAFSELALEWLELYESCPAATPFQSHAWLESWWREYGKSGRLRVVLVRRNGRLVAAAPLYLRRRGAFVVLAPLGGAISDYTDFLLRHDQGTETLKRLAVALREQPKWHVLDIPEAREGGAACQLFEVWPGHRKSVASSVCLELPGWPIEDLVSTLPASTARKTRSKLRKLAVAGILSHTVPPQLASSACCASFW